MHIPPKIKVWARYRLGLWRLEEALRKRKARFLYRFRRVHCALTDHIWIADKPPKYASPEWRQMAPMALLRMNCARCGERKFDNNRNIERQLGVQSYAR